MLKMLSEFGDNLKKYLNVIFKLNFGELFVYVLELLLTFVVAIITYYPVKLFKDLFSSILSLCGIYSGIIYNILEVLANIGTIICFILTFIYCFNIRYSELKQSEKEKKVKKSKEIDDIDLPSMKK